MHYMYYSRGNHAWDPEKSGIKYRFTFRVLFNTDYDPERDVEVKHFFSGDGRDMDIESYADLQRYSTNVTSIQGENYLLHIKETIPKYKLLLNSALEEDVMVDAPFICDTMYSYTHNCSAMMELHSLGIGRWGWVSYAGMDKHPDEGYVIVHIKADAHEIGYDRGRTYFGKQQIVVKSRSATYYQDCYVKYNPGYLDFWDQIPVDSILQVAANSLDTATWSKSKWKTLPVYGTYDAYEVPSYAPVDLTQFDPYWDNRNVTGPLHPVPQGLYPNLVAEAVSKTAFNSNTIANGLELFDLAASIKSGRIITDILKKGSIFAHAKDAWLAYRYQYNTTLSDVEELGRYIEQGSSTIVRAGKSENGGTMHVKVKLSPPESEISKLVKQLTESGVAPNLYNLWDMVPFSFIADWFISLGDVLEGLTKYGRVAAYNIVYITRSWRYEDEVERDGVKAKLVFYQREVTRTAPPYVPYIPSGGPSDRTVMARVADTVALFGPGG